MLKLMRNFLNKCGLSVTPCVFSEKNTSNNLSIIEIKR